MRHAVESDELGLVDQGHECPPGFGAGASALAVRDVIA
jgi:hypothetical protein